jgi:hypothetical protein
MKALCLVLILFALVLAAPAMAEAGTVVIVKTDATVMDVDGFSDGGDVADGFSDGGDVVKTDAGGVGPTPPSDGGGGSYYWIFTGVYGAPCPWWAPRIHVLALDPAGQYLVTPLQFACN